MSESPSKACWPALCRSKLAGKKPPHAAPPLFSVVGPLLIAWLFPLAPGLQEARPEGSLLLPSPCPLASQNEARRLVSCYPISLSKAVNKRAHMHGEVGYEKNLDWITQASCGTRVGR